MLSRLLTTFSDKQYIIGLDVTQRLPQVFIVLKEGHDQSAHLEAWVLANYIALRVTANTSQKEALDLTCDSKRRMERMYKVFLRDIQRAGWHTDTVGILTGAARTIRIQSEDDRKNR